MLCLHWTETGFKSIPLVLFHVLCTITASSNVNHEVSWSIPDDLYCCAALNLAAPQIFPRCQVAEKTGADWVLYQDLGDLEDAVRDVNPDIPRFDSSCFRCACLPAGLPAGLPACLPACLPVC